MADKTVTVKPIGGTYATLASAIAGELVANANLVTMEGILTISIEGDWSATVDTTEMGVNGFTTSAAYYLLIRTDAANRAKASAWDTTRYQYKVTDPTTGIEIRDDYVVIDGLQIWTAYTATGGRYGIYITSLTAAANHITISNCRLRGDTNTSANGIGIRTADADTVLDIYNCILYDWDSRGIYWGTGTTLTVSNCTIYSCTIGMTLSVAGATIKNCAVFATGDDFLDTPGTNTIDHCASDDNDGTNNVAGNEADATWSTDFTGAGTGNFELLVGSPLIGAGATALFADADDINGTARGAAWDLGAHEYVAGGTTVVPRAMMHYRRLCG